MDGTLISTHAPAGGATNDAAEVSFNPTISTHAPAGGATRRREIVLAYLGPFLLTPLREGRPIQPLQPSR